MAKLHNILTTAVTLLSLMPPLFGGDIGDDFETYYKTVKGSEPKVFETGDQLFVYSVQPFNSRKNNRAQAKLSAILQTKNLLKQWCIDYTAGEREKLTPDSKGTQYAYSVIKSPDPDVIFPWNVQLKTKEVPHKTDNGFYTAGQIIAKDDLIKSIPPEYSNPFTPERIFKGVETVAKIGMNGKKPEYFYKVCGLRDSASEDKGFKPGTTSEYHKSEKAISALLSESELAKKIKADKAEIEKAHINTEWSDTPQGEPVTVTEKKVTVTTNVPPRIEVKTNTLERPQSDDERKKRGVATGAVFNETTTISDCEEVVSETVTTTTETRKIIRRKTVSTAAGKAKMEDIFLSAGKAENTISEPRPSAAKAKEAFYGASDMVTKEKPLYEALCENQGDKELWNLFGRLLLNKKEYEASIICFRAALNLDRKYEYALVNLAEAYSAIGLKNLSYGLAFAARGLSANSWVISHSEAILTDRDNDD